MIRFTVRVKPGAHHSSVTVLPDGSYAIAVTERPERGKANDAVRRTLAAHLHVAPSRLSLIMGHASRTKVFELLP